MRELVQYIDPSAKKLVYTTFADSVDGIEKVENPPKTGLDLTQYRKRMDKLLQDNKDHITINKIRRLIPLTEMDLTELDRLLFAGKEEEREVFIRLYGDKAKSQLEVENPPISLLIRSLLGLEREDVEKKLAEYINRSGFNTKQIAFIDTLIDYFVRDGFVPVGALYEPPFDQFHFEGPEGLFGDTAEKVFDFVEMTNRLAMTSMYDSSRSNAG